MSPTLRRTALVAALLSSAAVPAVAAGGGGGSGVSGNFTIGAGVFDYDSTDGDDTTDAVVGGSASAMVSLSRTFSLQFDVVGEQIAVGDDLDQYASSVAFGGHLTYHSGSDWNAGVFAGFGSGTPTDEEQWSGGWFGVEGQFFWNRDITIIGQAAVLDTSDHGGEGEGFDDDAFLLRGVGRYFFEDDCKLELELAYITGDGVIDTDDDDAHAWEWGASIMTRLTDAPLYAGVAYRGGHYDAETEDDDAHVSSFMLTLSYLFGAKDLRDADRNGASLDTPTIVTRGSGIFSELD